MEKFGLLGEKLGHSFSKEIHEIFFKEKNKNAKYDLIEKKIEELPELLEELKKGKYKGINVTIPYKVEIMKYLDEVSQIAKKIGAVNTITYKDGKLIGNNSDYFGFLKTLQINNIDINEGKVLVLGTGGSAKAIYNVLIDQGAQKIFLATMTGNNKFPLRKEDRIIHYSEIKNLRRVDLIVNCTPVGMYPNVDMCPLIDENVIETKNVVDIIYNPKETVLMSKYKLKGVNVVNGLMMLISQAIKAEEIWHEEEYDFEIFEIIYKKLAKKLYE